MFDSIGSELLLDTIYHIYTKDLEREDRDKFDKQFEEASGPKVVNPQTARKLYAIKYGALVE